jgi:hypothetical protein
MRLTKNVLTSIGAVALAVVLVNVIAPQAVHAAVAALVQVSNPASSPALTSRIDDPGRIPYQQALVGSTTTVASGAVPANHRLVVQHISGQLTCTSSPSAGWLQITSPGGVIEFFTPAINSLVVSAFDQPVHFYVDQNRSFSILSQCVGAAFSSQALIVTGYLLDCNAAPCAAIASF